MKNKKVLIAAIVAVIVIVLAVLLLTGVIGGKKQSKITVALPNDATNEGRALLLLQAQGLIKLKDDAGITATQQDTRDIAKGLVPTSLRSSAEPSELNAKGYRLLGQLVYNRMEKLAA